jgi:hypothetical protein
VTKVAIVGAEGRVGGCEHHDRYKCDACQLGSVIHNGDGARQAPARDARRPRGNSPFRPVFVRLN